jgi:spore photoproduct lyase
MLKDSVPEKWEYEEHTKAKHELLRKYLSAWIRILGKFHRRILFFDGFAGRGEYFDKSGKVVALGSPVIALEVANGLLEYCEEKKRRPYFDEFVCRGVEKDPKNFGNLQNVIERERKKYKFRDKLRVELINDEFANVTSEILKELRESGQQIIPSFFFIDPFGFSGVPFKIVKGILSLRRTEIFFTFMSREINRFLSGENIEEILDELYENPDWREIIKISDWQKRDQALKDLYIKCLLEIAKVRYAWAFRVCMDEKYQTLYYLIHATNHFDGLKIMKDIMYRQGASGEFAYLGPREALYRSQLMLFNDDVPSLERFLLDRFSGQTKSFQEILEETYIDTRLIGKHYNEALQNLEESGKVRIDGKGPRRGILSSTRILFPHNNPTTIPLFSIPEAVIKPKVYYKEYQQLDGRRETMVEKVNDGSIIQRFDKTPLPEKSTDIVCPHFLELKWAYGCPFDCAWCYLKGTFRFRSEGTKPAIKDYEKIELHTRTFLEKVRTPEILNTGEIADSLMFESGELPFSKFIIPIFSSQKLHKVLFLTKSSNVRNLVEIEPHDQAIVSFSLNAIPVAEKWEKAPPVLKRIEAAKKVYQAGYEVRIRLDPMVPVEKWQEHYLHLVDTIFQNLMPERITLGSLRGLQSTINGCTDRSWVKYLKESSNWGKKIDFQTRYDMYSTIIRQLGTRYEFTKVALCKETVQMWDSLKMDYQKIRCNCLW